MSRGGALRGACECVRSRQGDRVSVQMVAVSRSLQTGDPGLKTGRFGLLKKDENKDFIVVEKKCEDTLPKCNFSSDSYALYLDEQGLVRHLHGFLGGL